MKKITQDDEMIAETERRYREFVEDPEARRAALERDIYIRDRAQMIRDAREEGIEQGIQVGREETARDVAMRLIESGIDDNVIQKATGLSSDELNTLRTQR